MLLVVVECECKIEVREVVYQPMLSVDYKVIDTRDISDVISGFRECCQGVRYLESKTKPRLSPTNNTCREQEHHYEEI